MAYISIVIPVYNTSKHLGQCLDSILNQSFTDFEVIMIDDGSTDDSGKICDKYASLDNRFLVYHTPNSGVSSARNKGISLANGDWVTFIDSDDWVDESYLEHMVKASTSQPKTEIVINTKVTVNVNDYDIEWKQSTDKLSTNSFDIVDTLIHEKLPTSMWCYLFKKNCLLNVTVDPEIHYYEDMDFLLQILKNEYNSVLNSDGGYHYRQGSYTHTKLTKKTLTAFIMVDKQIKNGIPADLCHFLDEKMILSVARVGLKDPVYDKDLNCVLKKRAVAYCRKKSNRKKNRKNQFIIQLIALSPKLYYNIANKKNRQAP